MKKLFYATAVFAVVIFVACNSEDAADTPKDPQQAKADSLYKVVMTGHDVAMPLTMGRLPKLRKQIEQRLDSLSRLPGEATATLRQQLGKALVELNEADDAMQNWMRGFVPDSANDNLEQRIKYLTEEEPRVNSMKEKVQKSVSHADSLLTHAFQ